MKKYVLAFLLFFLGLSSLGEQWIYRAWKATATYCKTTKCQNSQWWRKNKWRWTRGCRKGLYQILHGETRKWSTREVINSQQNPNKFVKLYADCIIPFRYFELIQKHGKLNPLVNVDLCPERRVKITFSCEPNTEVRTIDVYRTVADLKTRLEAFAGFSSSKMRLFYADQDLRDIQVSF